MSQTWAGKASGGSDPETSTWFLVATDGNQVSRLIKALSDVLLIPSREAGGLGLYSRSRAHLKKTIWNITIWCRDSGESLHADVSLPGTGGNIWGLGDIVH